MCQLKEPCDACVCWKRLRSTSLMLTSSAAPFALKWSLRICCFWSKQPLVFNLSSRMHFKLFGYPGDLLVLQGFGRALSLMRMCYYSITWPWKWKWAFQGETFRGPWCFELWESKAGRHMEKRGVVEGHLSPRLLCKTSRLSPSPSQRRGSRERETSTPTVFSGPSCIT